MREKTPFEKIHHIHPRFNRIFSLPLYLLSFVVILALFVSPYRIRVAIAVAINLILNRPLVYLNYFARWIARPMQLMTASLFYLFGVGAYALIFRATRRRSISSTQWVKSDPASDPESLYFQS